MTTPLVLFAYGASVPRWREPFDRLEALVRARHPGPLPLAFPEHMEPGLEDAARAVAGAGATRAAVVPLLLRTGGHLQEAVPVQLAQARAAAGIPVEAVKATGEDSVALAALADECTASMAPADRAAG